MVGKAFHLKGGPGGKASQFRKCLILILHTQNAIIFNNCYFKKNTFVPISEEEKVSCFTRKKK